MGARVENTQYNSHIAFEKFQIRYILDHRLEIR